MTDHVKIREAARRILAGDWEEVLAIYLEGRTTPNGLLVKGEAERIQAIAEECGVSVSVDTIRRKHKLGRWIAAAEIPATRHILCAHSISLSVLAVNAGLSPDETARILETEILGTRKDWTVTAFEHYLRSLKQTNN